MTIKLYAQPYDMDATGFYFETAEEFTVKRDKLTNSFGDPVEEFEIQFMDGDDLDGALADAIAINQANLADYLICVECWEDWQKINVIIAVGEGGYTFDAQDDPDHYGLDVYYADSLRELAEQFVDEGLYGDIPEQLQYYIDYDAIARDLAVEYTETVIAGEHLIYRHS